MPAYFVQLLALFECNMHGCIWTYHMCSCLWTWWMHEVKVHEYMSLFVVKECDNFTNSSIRCMAPLYVLFHMKDIHICTACRHDEYNNSRTPLLCDVVLSLIPIAVQHIISVFTVTNNDNTQHTRCSAVPRWPARFYQYFGTPPKMMAITAKCSL